MLKSCICAWKVSQINLVSTCYLSLAFLAVMCENILRMKMSLVQWLVAWISDKSARVAVASVTEPPASMVLCSLQWLAVHVHSVCFLTISSIFMLLYPM